MIKYLLLNAKRLKQQKNRLKPLVLHYLYEYVHWNEGMFNEKGNYNVMKWLFSIQKNCFILFEKWNVTISLKNVLTNFLLQNVRKPLEFFLVYIEIENYSTHKNSLFPWYIRNTWRCYSFIFIYGKFSL